MLPLAFGLGAPQDILIIAGVVILLFGGSKIAGFGKSLGEGIKEFKKATTDETNPPAAEVYKEPNSQTVVGAGVKTEEK